MLHSSPPKPPSHVRPGIAQCPRQDEADTVASLVAITEMDKSVCLAIEARARALISDMGRVRQPGVSMAGLLGAFPLSSPEGIQLMGLAEALLRIPNAATAEQLITDKLGAADWRSHLGTQQPLWLKGLLFGLLLSHKLASYTTSNRSRTQRQQLPWALLRDLQRRILNHGISYFGGGFVFASSVKAALTRAQRLASRGYSLSYDMLGEGARCARDAEAYLQRYRQMIAALSRVEHCGSAEPGNASVQLCASVSVKLSALHPRYEASQHQRVMAELVPRLLSLAQLARNSGVSLTIDAEESRRLDLSLDVFAAVYGDPSLAGWQGFGLAVQAYQKRALAVLKWLEDLAVLEGRQIPLRLVKGAYWDSEIKATQQGGYADYPVFTRKAATDLNYQACADFLLRHRHSFYPQFASHNPYTVATVLQLEQQLTAGAESSPGYEFQRLHGMGEALFETLHDRGQRCRVYAPVGKQSDLLSYLVRRILENGANSSVLKHLQHQHLDAEALVRPPRAQVLSWFQARHPRIPLPKDLFRGEGSCLVRRNSRGCDLDDEASLQALQAGMARHGPPPLPPRELCVVSQLTGQVEIHNPARCHEVLARLELDTADQLQDKLQRAELAFPAWASVSPEQRAHYLRQLANGLESHRDQLVGICTREGGKTLVDGISEVREAVDFCHYYAAQAEVLFATAEVRPRGVVLCISPWNFPLAIFIGQIAAALAVGNSVLAKPAMQSLLMARCVLDLITDSGFPADCCQLLLAPGAMVGQELVADPRIQAVLFTGSFATGRWLNRALAQRQPCALIAETGGQNAMVVDATALLEQVVDDVISSAFHSAGQRCSALRVLFVQQDIANALIAMLSGAMAELSIGDPALVSSDLGPLIDEPARQLCRAHCSFLQAQPDRARLIYACALKDDCQQGHYFAPHLYEIDNITLLKEEIFGPIVHLIRFPEGGLDEVMAQVNDSGYGLTLGIQSRIDSTCRELAQRAGVGNVYINRNMVGAVVGLQPFGGRGLSGTGPKAGGPLYLQGLVRWPVSGDMLANTSFKTASDDGEEGRHSRDDSVPGPVRCVVESPCGSIPDNFSRAQQDWSALGVEGRMSCLETLQQEQNCSPAVSQVVGTSLKEEVGEMLRLARELLTVSLLAGPTGESNCYQLQSRGLILIVVDEASGAQCFLRQLLALLLAGNSALVLCAPDSPFSVFWRALRADLARAGLAPELCATASMEKLSALLDEAPIEAVCLPPGSALEGQIAQRLANRPGAICPLINELNPAVLITRLSYEKTISTNTAAAGGNIALLSLED
ncbi:MAG: bifunctional proline dehydrogenase/L-glutamate gamma-semialdehyde dehydrogenase PutA [Porticoccaceae bacterium]|nr:bifunctional proline dehydrogenase/L-glutamate gamma-semialdehyde dehydrogenase PutA [Porticoccaceae bacterium]